MIQFNVDHTPPAWPVILQHLQAGETVQVLRGQHLVAIIHAPDDLQAWPLQSSTQLAHSLPPEDFSDWNAAFGVPPSGDNTARVRKH